MAMNFEKESKKTVLLTGAGFTKNFGGFLGEEMWAEIYNDPKVQDVSQSANVKTFLGEENNYEIVYDNIVDLKSQFEMDVFNDALKNALGKLDVEIRDHHLESINENDFWTMIKGFLGNKNERGFFFTLNQDLFIERFYSSNVPEERFEYAGLNSNKPINITPPHKELEGKDFISIGDFDEDKAWEILEQQRSCYVKLHGSYHWRDKTNGNRLLLTGQEKTRNMNPLLRWYFDGFFKRLMFSGNVKLLIIGYGFQDIPINKVIAEAI